MTFDQVVANHVIVIFLAGWYLYSLAKESGWFGL